ncbi:MAG: ketopantoate reductase family protein [Bacteroidota bacterium]
MKFVVVGTGGVGGYFGGKLALSGADVWFVARGTHLQTMKARGLKVRASDGEFVVPPGKMTDDYTAIGPADVVLFCVKSYDTEAVASRLSPLLSPHTIVISLQNGIDNEEKLRQTLSTGIVWGGVSYIYSTITAPGEISETGGPRKIIFGPLAAPIPGTATRGKKILAMFTTAGISATLSEHIQSDLWKKFIFISAVGGLTTLTRLTLGEILAVEPTRQLLVDAMREVEAIAKAKGVAIAPDYIDHVFDTVKRPDSNRSSMYHDLVHNKPLEIEAFSGTIVRYGMELNIPTPIHATVYAALLPYHLKHSQALG